MAVGIKEVEIVKARTDKRDYRRIVLSNSLEVLLISDPDTDKAAASMNVAVGSFSDPDGLEGLAHFLEHMLFYASEKYPLEDSYSKYITEHGGSTNAFTASENTNFYFDVNVDSFEEAFDRFAQFFIKPLMSPDATLREIKAVDSENQKNLLSDGWRMRQLQKHLCSKDHPYHKFSTGNWNTLDTVPKAKGLDTRNELIRFYKENYSANLMHLVVYGRDSLDEIQSLVVKKFQDVPNIGRSCIHFSGQPCTSEHLEILVKAVPIKQGHKLQVIWPITPSIRSYKEGPSTYVGHLIGHEGEGSLFFILKKLGWAMSLGAGEGDWSYDFSFFFVVIELTDAGHEHVEEIVGLLFKYILLLKNSGINKWIFDELAAICATVFHYQDKVPPIDYVARVASNMQLYAPEDWLVASSLPSKFVPSTIEKVLDQLSPKNVRIFWESKKFEGCTNLVEPWYGTPYSIERITASLIQQWVEKAPDEDLHLPAPNVFIPTDLSLKTIQNKVKFPILLWRSSYSRLWYKPDTMFFTPKAYVRIDFNCPQSNHSPEAEVLTDIFTRLLMDDLNEYAYDAEVAGLYYGIHHTGTGFQIVVVGYNHKMRILLEAIIEKIAKFEVKADRFYVIKEAVLKEYQNFKFQKPYQQALYYCSLLLSDQSWPLSEELDVLPQLETSDLAKFIPQLLSKAFLEGYIAGNVEPNEAESIIKHIEEILFEGHHSISKPLFPSQHIASRIVKLEKGVSFCYPVEVLNQSDENSALVHYIQVHQDDIKLNVKLQLFARIAKQPAFHQLRSVEQLGYITLLMQRNDSGIRGMQIVIQSTVKDPAQLDERVEAFLKMFDNKLCEMSVEEYKSNVNALIDMKLEKYKNLREESSFYWREIADGTLRFERIESEVAALRDLTREELMDFFNEHIKVGALRRKALSILVYGGLHSEGYKIAKSASSLPQKVLIDDIFTFRRSRPLYGSLKGGFGQMKL
uniref:Zinc-metallopeptidase, peroxisomal n=1 Tax=Anthurium amnicola TaxID=1678845 RepID=A0A1D1YFR5_9ARAE